ncbi:hypothetical protein AB3S75_020744 [Citrus x aurantiifolia]
MVYSREILNFLVKKDVRKILKRKDSDAGERGKALEELQASLFNRFRSPDGAKRQEQRLCGPIASLTFNFVVAVSIIFMNKWVLKNIGFQFPIFLSFIHYAVSWALMAILNAFALLPASPPAKSGLLSLFTLGFVMSFSTGLANVSLKYNSVGFYQMAKIAVTPSIVLAEFIWYRNRVSVLKVVTLTVVSIGVAVATQRESWTALALMWKTTPITLLFLGSLIPCLDPPGVLSFNWNFSNTLAILMSAFLGFLLQWSGALALGATSAISHVVLGQFKTCIILLGNYYIFGANPGTISICGAFVAIVGMSFYTYLNLCNSKHQSSKASLQNGSSLPKSKLIKENGEKHDGYGDESV